MEKKNRKVRIGRQKFSAEEFDESRLPSNRFFQFFDVLRIEWRTLALVGLLLLLFSLPILLASFFRPLAEAAFSASLSDQGATEDEIRGFLNIVDAVFLLSSLLTFPVFAVGLAGCANVIKSMVYGDGFIFRFLFFEGIRKNGKFFVLSALVTAVIYSLVAFNSLYLSQMDSFLPQFIRFLTVALFYVFCLPIMLFASSNFTTYKMKVSECLSNGYKCTFARFLFVLPFSLAFYGVSCLSYLKNPVFIGLGQALAVLVAGPLLMLAWRLFAVSAFDFYINQNHYKEIYRKGLKPLPEQESQEEK